MRDMDSELVCTFALKPKPELVVDIGNLPQTAVDLRDLFATSGKYYDRGIPTHVVKAEGGEALSALPLTKHNIAMEAHRLCQPVIVCPDGERVPVTLPNRVAGMYIDMVGEWMLPPLAGISAAPLLSDDGSIRSADGYDPITKLLCRGIPELNVADRPSYVDAKKALELIRQAFRTFPFGDAPRCQDTSLGVEVTNITEPLGRDESAFLVALLTAVCRPSLFLAPALLVTAPDVSGAGSGKGLLVRAICNIAFGIKPSAFTTGGDRQELDKRLAAELIEARPVLFVDNANGITLRSDLLASVLTERPVRVRLLGRTRMVPLNSTAFLAVTGNALTVTEDLARRFIVCELDARCEDPESRPFSGGFLDDIESRRTELLTSVLIIWRWGRQNANSLVRGKSLGGFETWARWCRDPLLALGSRDPVER